MRQTITFNFQNPVSGEARFYPIDGRNTGCQRQLFESDGIHPLDIQVGRLGKGRWKLELDWAIGEHRYALNREFSVPLSETDTGQ